MAEEKREWLINIIIGVRQEVLEKLRELSDSFDREKYTRAQRGAINQEIREFAELVSEKDSIMKRVEALAESTIERVASDDSLVSETRTKIKKMLKDMKNNILAIRCDGEYSIIMKELTEMELILEDKDRLLRTKVPTCYSKGRMNSRLKRYFNIPDESECVQEK